MYEVCKLHHGEGISTAFSHLLVCIRNLRATQYVVCNGINILFYYWHLLHLMDPQN